MKRLRNIIVPIITGVLITGLALNFNACKEQSPLQPDNNLNNQLNFVTLEPDTSSLGEGLKGRTVSIEVTKKYGGTLRMEFRNRDDLEQFDSTTAVVRLDVLPGSVDGPVDISLTVPMERGFVYGHVNMEYAPHGLIFERSAILNIDAVNLDLSSLDPTKVDVVNFYYVNQETGNWELMECEQLVIDIEQGIIRLVNGKLPHFSRYAVAWSR